MIDTLLRWARRIGVFGGVALGLLYLTFCAYNLPRTVKVHVTGNEVVRRNVEQEDGTTRVQDVNYITAEDLDGEPRIFRNLDTGWGWPPYFKFDSGNLLAQANNLAIDDPPSIALVRYYGFRIPVLSLVPNAVSMRVVTADHTNLPVFNIAFAIAHIVLIGWGALRIRQWRRGRTNTTGGARSGGG